MKSLNIFPLLIATLASSFITILWLYNLFYKIIILSIAKWKLDFGKLIQSYDAFNDENYVQHSPKCSLVASMTFEGDLDLEKVKKLFYQNVLQARHPSAKNILRYPELKQYPVSWMGFRFWKNDCKFNLENHISQLKLNKELEMDKLHGELLNKKYPKDSSPWELLLVKNPSTNDDNVGQRNQKCFLFLRIHHIMADAKSIVKLIVECLGNKNLTVAEANYPKRSSLERIFDKIVFPFQYVLCLKDAMLSDKEFQHHSWKPSPTNCNPYIVAFSAPLSLSKIKWIAKQKSVTTSSILITLVGEGLSSFFSKRGLTSFKDLLIGYSLPKPNHPPTLGTHVYMSYITLPMDKVDITQRLEKSHESFINAKNSDYGKCQNALVDQAGSMIYPLRRYLFGNSTMPFVMSNIAGEEEGFEVGGLPCVDFSLSGGASNFGVFIIIFSYKNTAKISVISSNDILSYEDAQELASQPERVLQLLIKSNNIKQ